ncbi:MAG: hypothetical protein KDA96_13635 [Planctomycetaceae bacterium]|nr:hypothetical protein [Planctomycetaceae bacterium]
MNMRRQSSSYASQSSLRGSAVRTRRGVLSLWGTFALAAMLVIAAVSINRMWAMSMREDAQRCTEAAALAAAHELLTDEILKTNAFALEGGWREYRCRHAAVRMGQLYASRTRLPRLYSDNVELIPRSSRPSMRNSDWDQRVPAYVRVGYQTDGTPRSFPLLMPGVTGVSSALLDVSSSVELNNHLVGFRSANGVNIPMLPFVAEDRSSADSSSWKSCIEDGRGRDQFSWNQRGDVVESLEDGIPEIEFRLHVADNTEASSANGRDEGCELQCLQFSAGTSQQPGQAGASDAERIRRGLCEADLHGQPGNLFQFPQSMTTTPVTAKSLTTMSRALADIEGQERILCLCEPAAETGADRNAGSSVQLVRPVAVRILSVRRKAKDDIRIVCQPCVLTTPTAIMQTDRPQPENRYIWSVRLCSNAM